MTTEETSGDADPIEVVERYLASKSKGTDDSGAYRQTAETALTQWYEWLQGRNCDRLADLDDQTRGTTLMRRYAQRLGRRVRGGDVAPSTARTYYNVVSGFLSFAVRDGVLDRNPALTDRAREPLPDDDTDNDQQFWDRESRDRILRYVDDRAYEAIEERGSDALQEARDRAVVYLLAYTGVRGAEVLRSQHDSREGRQGLRWKHVDTDRWVLRVFGKAQEWEAAPVPRPARAPLERWQQMLDPPSEEWPVFPTDHAPSKYRVAREELGRDDGRDLTAEEVEALLDERDVDDVLHGYDIVPPAITTDGMRSRMRTLCEDADVDIDGEYLKLHGARRGIGDEVFRKDRGLAQDLLRHKSLATTKEAYSHIAAEERGERISDLLDE